jgi:heme-degrading monooxygenase HmoA
MVMTILEAIVAQDRIEDLERAYREGTAIIPPEVFETFLVRDTQDETLFRIITVWTSRAALEQMRATVDKPKGVQIFEAAGATPALMILDVVAHQPN